MKEWFIKNKDIIIKTLRVIAIILIVLFSLFMILRMPFIISNKLFVSGGIPVRFNAGDVLGYYGSLLGGVLTIIAMVITLKVNNNNLAKQRSIEIEDRLSEIKQNELITDGHNIISVYNGIKTSLSLDTFLTYEDSFYSNHNIPNGYLSYISEIKNAIMNLRDKIDLSFLGDKIDLSFLEMSLSICNEIIHECKCLQAKSEKSVYEHGIELNQSEVTRKIIQNSIDGIKLIFTNKNVEYTQIYNKTVQELNITVLDNIKSLYQS